MELTTIILNWNAAADTVRCVQQLSAWQRLRPMIVVVDNASADDSCAVIARECPQAHLICNSVNEGFSGGNNRGIEAAMTVGDAPVLLLNNDASIAEDDAIRLIQTLQSNPEIGLIGPVLFDAGRRERMLSVGSKDPSRHHHSHNYHMPGEGPVLRVECIPGTVILIRTEIFRSVGLLDEAYFFGSEVADLCMLSRDYGYQSVIDTRAKAFHRLQRSSKFRDTLYPYYIIRNRFLLIRKFHRRWKFLFYIFWTLYSLALSLKLQMSGKSSMARSILLGLLDGLQGRFGNQNERVVPTGSGSNGKLD